MEPLSHSWGYSLEMYRRKRYCPVPGCSSNKPLKKLSNHLTALHPGLSPQERQKYLKEAKGANSGQSGLVKNPSLEQRSLSSFFSSEAGPSSSNDHDGSIVEVEMVQGRDKGKGKMPVGGGGGNGKKEGKRDGRKRNKER